jgi:hypothetical protein
MGIASGGKGNKGNHTARTERALQGFLLYPLKDHERRGKPPTIDYRGTGVISPATNYNSTVPQLEIGPEYIGLPFSGMLVADKESRAPAGKPSDRWRREVVSDFPRFAGALVPFVPVKRICKSPQEGAR